jgi:signal transduction histidine kinase
MRLRTLPLLAAIFGTLLALNIFTSACVFFKTGELQDQFAGAESRYHRAANLLIELRSDIYASMFTVQQYLLSPTPDARQRTLRELSSIKQSSEAHISGLRAQFFGGAKAQQLSVESGRYWDLLHQFLEPVNAPQPVSQKLSEGTAALEQALRATRDMDEINTTGLREEQLELEADKRSFSHFLLWITSLNVTLGLVVSIVSLARLRRLERESEAERQNTRRAESDLRHLSQQLVKAQEEERKNISRELHDEVGQLLTGLRIELGNLQRRNGDKRGVESRILDAKELAEKALRTVRNMAMLLRPSMLDDQGLAPALRWQAREFSRRFEIPVSVEIEGDIDRIPAGHAVCLYRVVQEVLTNCAKHAQAKRIQISVNATESLLSAVVDDDGVGFRSRSGQQSNGIGLLGIAERIYELRGTFFIDSEPGRGTRVNVTLPIPKAEPA